MPKEPVHNIAATHNPT